MSKSPFKFLDSYTKEDKEIFFGRDREIEEMYQKVFESKMLLVYGISGTGKTSLINCGLANKFEDSDWLPVSVRRGRNVVESLERELGKVSLSNLKSAVHSPQSSKKDLPPDQIVKALKSIYLDHFKPIYLIFDQFEELFIFGDREEREEFIQIVKAVVDSDVQCRFIFSIREEYLAGVTEFERLIPEFLANRMRIEKMTSKNAIQVIEGPCKVHSIEVEEGFSETVLEKLSPETSEVELTYLQVFLDKAFRLATDKDKGKPGFTNELLEQVGDVSDLLGSFLEEQISQLENPDSGLVILKSFVSIKGTKRQVTLVDVSDFATTLGKKISGEELKNLIIRFVKLRILRDKDENGRYELRHDGLATKIYEKITLVEKELLEVRQFIDSAYSNFEKRKKLLGSDDLEYIAPYERKLFLSHGITRFIETSKREVQKARRRRRQAITVLAVALIAILSGFTIWALSEKKKSDLNYIKAQANNFNFVAKEVVDQDPTTALRLAEYALTLDTTNEKIKDNLRRIYYDNSICQIIAKHESYIISVAFSPDGKTILTGSSDNTARLWDLQGNELQVFKGHEHSVWSVAFSPDGKTILTGSEDRTARLWDLQGNQLQVFKGQESQIMSIAFSPDGKTILTGSRDNTARLWDLEGNELQIFIGHEKSISSVAFSPDGNFILTGSRDRTARLYDVKPSLEEFQKKGFYERLDINQKIKYGILVYKNVYKLKDEDELYEAADYYYETAGILGKDKKIEYLNNSMNLYEEILLKHEKVKYFIGLLDVYSALYNIEPSNEKSIKRINEIYDELFSINDYNELLERADYFYSYFMQNKEISLKLKFHDKALQLYRKILTINNVDEQTKADIARSCSNFSWSLLEEKEFENALQAALIAKEADPSSLLTYTNLALSYLFTDQFEEAKKIYLKWKDKPYNEEFETLKDVFLVDIKDLEGMGITHPDFEKVRALLEK